MIQKKMNVDNKYFKQVKECAPSGVNPEEEIQKVVADNYRHTEGHTFLFYLSEGSPAIAKVQSNGR
jgi:hypothetical protein